VGEESKREAACSRFCSNCTVNTLLRQPFSGLENSELEGKQTEQGNLEMTLCCWLRKERC
jgi:hypothetical protein